MTVSSVTQRMGVHYSGDISTLQAVLAHVSPEVERSENEKGQKTFRLFSAVDVIVDKNLVTLEVIYWINFLQSLVTTDFVTFLQWIADSVNDMFADAVLSAILKCESLQGSRVVSLPATVDNIRFKVFVFVRLPTKKCNFSLFA